MTNADWWATTRMLVPSGAAVRCDAGRVLTLRRDHHEPALDLRRVPGFGHELVLFVNRELRRARLFRRHQPLELIDAIAETMVRLKAKGWAEGERPREIQ